MNYLARNRAAYEELVDAALRLGDRVGPDLRLGLIGKAAWFATVNHPGRFADHRLENAALAVGADLDRLAGKYPGRPVRLPRLAGKRHVLHVATEVAGLGGHTRTIRYWAEFDRESVHSLALTYQAHDAVPRWITDAIVRSGGQVIVLPVDAPPVARALGLRALARDADLVVSHHFTEDVVPLAAFAAPDLPPVGLLNQSDHVFWLGGAVSDTIINLRDIGRVLSEQRRATRHNTLLPIPLDEPPPALARDAARRKLGIDPERVVLLSVGRATKYLPTATHNFFATGTAALAAHPDADLYLVGVRAAEAAPYLSTAARRFHCVGPVEAPDEYRAAADVYLEGFPFGSQTALLEAGLAGLAPVPAFAPLTPLLVTQDEAYDGLLVPAPSAEAYLAHVADLGRSPSRRAELGAECARRVRAAHVGDGWLHRLNDLYRTMSGLRHGPRPIEPAPAGEPADDVGLSLFHAFNTDAPGDRTPDIRPKLRRAAFEAAFGAREAGDYVGAWRTLRYARRAWGDDRDLARARTRLVPHWLLRRRRRHAGPIVLS